MTHNYPSQRKVKHGWFGTPEYQACYSAKHRCENENNPCYDLYGGRGIEFKFTSFEDFIAELGRRPPGMSLDRINNDGHYESGNIRWATASQQQKNRRSRKP